VTFELPPGHNDYLGESIDKAARLCSAASPQAIFVDVATTASAQMNKVRSRVGEVLRRPIAEYQGDVQRASLTGFSAPVEYHEILWAQQLFGLKSKVLTATLDSVADRRADMPRPSGQTPLRGERGRRGVVTHLDTAKHHWFIKADDGEPFYTDARFVVSEDELQIGDVVYFLPRPSLVEGKARLAGAVVAVDQDVEGTVVSVLDGFAFVRIADSRGNMQDIFVSLGDCSFSVERHQHVEFTVGESDRGAKAEDLEPAVPRPRKAA
jgi:cold shock CspA family protein